MRAIAYFLSVVFHPLLMLTYMLLLLLALNPYLFGVHQVSGGMRLILLVFLSTFFIPAFSVGMMKALGLISSLEMPDKQERIGPYIVTGVFYLWMFQNLVNNPDIPQLYSVAVLGATMALFVAFIINIFSKISAHAVGMGGLLGLMVLAMATFEHHTFVLHVGSLGYLQMHFSTALMIILFLAGLVGTARLWLKAHEPADIYGGFLVGLAMQFIAFGILMA